MKRTIAALALLALVSGCSQSANQSSSQASAAPGTSGASPAPAATNPIDFPLYEQSTVISAKPFAQKAGTQTVAGTEVIAENPATLAQLGDWIKGLGTTPPTGYMAAPSSTAVNAGRARVAAMGVQFQAFTHEVSGSKHVLVVLVVDPTMFDAKAGFMLSAIGRFKMLPQSIKDQIDAQAKARTGYSVSDALNPSTPIGAALAAVNTLHDSGQRGVVLIDGTKN